MLDAYSLHSIAHMFQPQRLTLARDTLAITKSELATRIGKTPSAITQLEAGRIKPDPDTILRLALTLGVPPGFFAYESPAAFVPIEACHFRSLRSTRQRERRRILAKATYIGDLIHVLEHYVDLPSEQVSSHTTDVSSHEDIERCTADLRRHWGLGLGPIPDVVKLLEGKGIIVCPIEEQSARVDAFSFWRTERPFVLLVTTKRSSSRTRFDAAHELGHLIMHADALPGDASAERQADRFASAFLLPRDSFYRECPSHLNWDHFRELKRRWRVSLAALVRRARDLGRITEASYKRAYVQLNRMGYRTSEPDEPPTERPQLITRSIAIASETVPVEALASDSGMTPVMFSELRGMLEAFDTDTL